MASLLTDCPDAGWSDMFAELMHVFAKLLYIVWGEGSVW